MAKDPAFLFYTQDFQIGTQFFSDEQVGKYIRLLMAQHQHGHLSENQVIMICKSYDNEVMSKFIKDSEGKWYNERLELEADKRKKFTESRGNNKRGKKIISKSYDSHMENENCITVLDNNNTQSTYNSKSINQFPNADSTIDQLNSIDANSAIEIYKLRKGILLTHSQVANLFSAFKLQALDGKIFHADERDIIKHFKNWLPGQKVEQQQINGNGRRSINSLI